MWNLLRDWLIVSTAVRGPEATRARVRSGASLAGRLVRLALLGLWWLLVASSAVGAGVSLLRGRWADALVNVAVAGVLVLLRWLWWTRGRPGRAGRSVPSA